MAFPGVTSHPKLNQMHDSWTSCFVSWKLHLNHWPHNKIISQCTSQLWLSKCRLERDQTEPLTDHWWSIPGSQDPIISLHIIDWESKMMFLPIFLILARVKMGKKHASIFSSVCHLHRTKLAKGLFITLCIWGDTLWM